MAKRALDFHPGDIVEVRVKNGNNFYGVVVDKPRRREAFWPATKALFDFVYILPLRSNRRNYWNVGGWLPQQCRLIIRPPQRSKPVPDNVILGEN